MWILCIHQLFIIEYLHGSTARSPAVLGHQNNHRQCPLVMGHFVCVVGQHPIHLFITRLRLHSCTFSYWSETLQNCIVRLSWGTLCVWLVSTLSICSLRGYVYTPARSPTDLKRCKTAVSACHGALCMCGWSSTQNICTYICGHTFGKSGHTFVAIHMWPYICGHTSGHTSDRFWLETIHATITYMPPLIIKENIHARTSYTYIVCICIFGVHSYTERTQSILYMCTVCGCTFKGGSLTFAIVHQLQKTIIRGQWFIYFLYGILIYMYTLYESHLKISSIHVHGWIRPVGLQMRTAVESGDDEAWAYKWRLW